MTNVPCCVYYWLGCAAPLAISLQLAIVQVLLHQQLKKELVQGMGAVEEQGYCFHFQVYDCGKNCSLVSFGKTHELM